MYNANISSTYEIPSTGRLIRSTVIALLTAIFLLITVVMPAEYGIDPTGFGEITGLKRMGEIKVSLAEEAIADRASTAASLQTELSEAETVSTMETAVTESLTLPPKSGMSHEKKITLAPNQGTEIKVTMTKGSKVHYVWRTNGGTAVFDQHGDSKELKISYHSYSKGAGQMREGVLEAAFDGNHGWFWRNRTSIPMTITLKTEGEYTGIRHFK
ncbi:transmembrane anchor protein [Nitrosomonas sp.]|uniref:transmembrane anchor protein n=1 Tax=Nitrosomonas sp. TaxID=42353 RepID=UPI0037C5D33C